MMRSFSLFLFVSLVIVGCASSAPPPAASEASSRTMSRYDAAPLHHHVRIATKMFIRLPKGWHVTQLKDGLMAAIDPDELAVVGINIKVVGSKEAMERMVTTYRMNAARDEDTIVLPTYRQPGSDMIGFRYITTVHGVVNQGATIVRPSNMEGIVLGFTGLWPMSRNKEVIPQFAQIVKTTTLR